MDHTYSSVAQRQSNRLLTDRSGFRNSPEEQNAASQWSTTVPHMDGKVGSNPTGGTQIKYALVAQLD